VVREDEVEGTSMVEVEVEVEVSLLRGSRHLIICAHQDGRMRITCTHKKILNGESSNERACSVNNVITCPQRSGEVCINTYNTFYYLKKKKTHKSCMSVM
jgi:hypothetical protein